MLLMPPFSLSTWKPLLLFQPPVLHGEKLIQNQRLNGISLDLINDMDSNTTILDCVSPYEINPKSVLLNTVKKQPQPYQQYSNQPDAVPIAKRNIKLEMEEFGDLAPYLATTSTIMNMANSIDELNTPVFDRKGPFDFMIQQENTYHSAEDPFKFEYETIISNDTNSEISNKELNDITIMNILHQQQQQQNEIHSNIISSTTSTTIIQGSEAITMPQYSPSNNNNNKAEQCEIYIINESQTPMHAQIVNNSNNNNINHNIVNLNNNNNNNNNEQEISASSSSLYKIEDNNSVISDNQYSNVSSPSSYDYFVQVNMNGEGGEEEEDGGVTTIGDGHNNNNNNNNNNSSQYGIDTPEDSNSSIESTIVEKRVPKLKINLNFLNQSQILNTPDVIDSVVELESSFLDYINDKEVTTVKLEDIRFEDPSTPSSFKDFINTEPDETIIARPKPRTKRKPKRYDDDDDDDDDEDYVPPTKRSAVATQPEHQQQQQQQRKPSASFIEQQSDSDSDSDALEDLKLKVTTKIHINNKSNRRGRPPRRTSSVSSDYSDASKYRELRDKNNEASRKSRLKRKLKEVHLEQEADEMYEKNIKLKAQVSELEKMVTNFRENLFKIMLKK